MTLPDRMKFGIFLAPFHPLGENPTLSMERDLELIQLLDHLGYDEAWVGEHHSAGWEIIASPEVFIAAAAERTKHIRLGTGVVSLPYHHPLMVANRMTLLDHLTRGRVMLGVGPGALTSDALMLGIDPSTQRPRMDEAMGIILRLFREEEPITYESDWFTMRNARMHLRPFTRPHMPIAVAAVQSPAGMITAGKHGAGVLSLSLPRGSNSATALREFWKIAEDTAAEHGKTMDRNEWRIVIHCHLAETREQALAEARDKSGHYQRDYFETTLGHPVAVDGPMDTIMDTMVERGLWCVGTPDDLVAMIHRLDERSGGFGGLMIQATEWASREQVFRSYELLARYVMPQFQGSLRGLQASQAASQQNSTAIRAMQVEAVELAKRQYAERGSR
ncbi:MAG TPA: LLM class flavin-dependent oxidoreductase [Dehalococcoidia bacterium]|nr:LLM class flavin-dependent oxidoreductase [Dehalococcoidia bacterium]